jgi:4-hydroxy-tetrahydrodipicolinate synthase
MELLEDLVDADIDPAVLMPGTGTCSITDTAVLTQHAIDIGCGGVLMLPPFYYKNPGDDGLFRYFADVIDEVGDDRLKLYLYHIPPIAQVGFTLELIRRLKTEFPGIVVGMKDSSGDFANMKAVLEAFPGFEFFPGAELYLLPCLKLGGAGVISATANVAAPAMRRLFDNWTGPDAERMQEEISAVRKTVQGFPVIPVLKAIVAHYRNDADWARTRPPFLPLDQAEAARAINTLAEQHGFKLDFPQAA